MWPKKKKKKNHLGSIILEGEFLIRENLVENLDRKDARVCFEPKGGSQAETNMCIYLPILTRDIF